MGGQNDQSGKPAAQLPQCLNSLIDFRLGVIIGDNLIARMHRIAADLIVPNRASPSPVMALSFIK